jgi:hypothetical protein
MDSLTANLTVSLSGAAIGTTSLPDNFAPLIQTFSTMLASTSSGATKANKILYFAQRQLGAGSDETHDLTSFNSPLNESSQSLSLARFWVFIHPTTSAASSVRVGGAGTPFGGMLTTASGTRDVGNGGCFVEALPTTAGMGISAGMGIKVLNSDASNIATYVLAVVGE